MSEHALKYIHGKKERCRKTAGPQEQDQEQKINDWYEKGDAYLKFSFFIEIQPDWVGNDLQPGGFRFP